MYKYICEDCGGRCDPGELVGNVCPECAEKQRMKNVIEQKVGRMLNAPYEQMELSLGGNWQCRR